MADIIQADHDALQGMASKFAQQSQAVAQMQQSVLRSYQPLRAGGWIGRGSEAFVREMEGQVLPAVRRLVDALAQANQITKQISELLGRADEEASSAFKQDGIAGGTGAGMMGGLADPMGQLFSSGAGNGAGAGWGAGGFTPGMSQNVLGLMLGDMGFSPGGGTDGVDDLLQNFSQNIGGLLDDGGGANNLGSNFFQGNEPGSSSGALSDADGGATGGAGSGASGDVGGSFGDPPEWQGGGTGTLDDFLQNNFDDYGMPQSLQGGLQQGLGNLFNDLPDGGGGWSGRPLEGAAPGGLDSDPMYADGMIQDPPLVGGDMGMPEGGSGAQAGGPSGGGPSGGGSGGGDSGGGSTGGGGSAQPSEASAKPGSQPTSGGGNSGGGSGPQAQTQNPFGRSAGGLASGFSAKALGSDAAAQAAAQQARSRFQAFGSSGGAVRETVRVVQASSTAPAVQAVQGGAGVPFGLAAASPFLALLGKMVKDKTSDRN